MMRRFGIAAWIIGTLLCLVGAVCPLILMLISDSPAHGIIGGAGWPTYFLLLSSEWGGLFTYLIFIGILLWIAGAFLWIIGRRKEG